MALVNQSRSAEVVPPCFNQKPISPAPPRSTEPLGRTATGIANSNTISDRQVVSGVSAGDYKAGAAQPPGINLNYRESDKPGEVCEACSTPAKGCCLLGLNTNGQRCYGELIITPRRVAGIISCTRRLNGSMVRSLELLVSIGHWSATETPMVGPTSSERSGR